MYFTLAVSASAPGICAALADRARVVSPALLPIPGPAVLAWRSPDGRAALLHWGRGAGRAASHAGTIWAGTPTPGSGRTPVYGRTGVTRVDPVYVAEVPGAVVVADRAMWAAWTAGRIDAHDPLHAVALLNPGFPLGPATPFSGVSAAGPSTTLHLLNGALTRVAERPALADAGRRGGGPGTDRGGLADLGLADPAPGPGPAAGGPAGAGPGTALVRAGSAAPALPWARTVAAALVAAVAPLRDAGRPVELSLTGGRDSRLVAAALAAAGVPVVARTHGFPGHPDVVLAAEIAARLGIEHAVRTPAAPGQHIDVLARIRASVLVADGMLSAFENVGRPDPAPSSVITAGGHGGELLRGGYAETAGRPGGRRRVPGPAWRAARAAEMFRRLTAGHLGLIRRGQAAGYLASLAPWTAALARGPLPALDDFYLVNRAGRWSAAARQAYLIRERLVQPLFDDRVVLTARAVPLADRVSGALSAAVLAELSPALAGVPLAGKAPPPGGRPGAAAAAAAFDWRRQYGGAIGSFLREYVLDLGAAGGLFDVVSRPAAERLLATPQSGPGQAWALATLACLFSADYRRAREPSPYLPVA